MEMLVSLSRPGGLLEVCKTELQGLEKKLEPETGWKALRKTLVWPLQKTELNKVLDILERSKTTINLALVVDQA